MIRLFELAQKSKLKVFLFGATPQVNQKSVELIRKKYPYEIREKVNDFVLSKYIGLDTFIYFYFNQIFNKESKERIISRFNSSVKNLFNIEFNGVDTKLIKKNSRGLEYSFV